MLVKYNKRFLKDLASIPKKYQSKIADFVFKEILSYQNSSEIQKIEKLTGYHQYFKIRFGNYRVGIKLENEELIFERVLHRKEIYKFFP